MHGIIRIGSNIIILYIMHVYCMEINVKKTKSMVASKKQETPKVSINLDGTAIEQVKKWSTWVV